MQAPTFAPSHAPSRRGRALPPEAAVLLLVVAVIAATGCRREEEKKIDAATYAAPKIDAASYTTARDAAVVSPIVLRDVTAGSGVAFTHTTGAFGAKWMPETVGSGVVVFDANGDGHLDLFFVDGTAWTGGAADPSGATTAPGRCALYLGRGDMTFVDATEAWGAGVSLYGMGATAGDFDGDGDLDLYITAVGANVLLRNDGDRFTDVTAEAGVAGGTWRDAQGRENEEWSVSAGWLDFDGDGVLDLFVANYVHWSAETDVYTTLDGRRKSYATPAVYPGQSCRLYRGRGDGTFEDVTEAAGVFNPEGKSMSLAFEDFDDDGHVDILVTNDTQPNFLYLNMGDGTFVDVALAAGVAFDENGRARAGMGTDVADLSNRGRPTIAIGNFSRESISLYELQGEGPVFLDVAGSWKIARPSLMTLTFPLVAADFDGDGYLDLLAGNGHIEPEINSVASDITFEQPMQLYLNCDGMHFEDLGAGAGDVFARPLVVRGLATGDFDGDGAVDVVVAQNGGPALVLRNESPGAAARSVRFDLRDGTTANTRALGARVFLTSREEAAADAGMEAMGGGLAAALGGATTTQRRMVRTGSSFLSQSDLMLSFGLPTGHRIVEVKVVWPDGEETVVGELIAPGAAYCIERTEAGTTARAMIGQP